MPTENNQLISKEQDLDFDNNEVEDLKPIDISISNKKDELSNAIEPTLNFEEIKREKLNSDFMRRPTPSSTVEQKRSSDDLFFDCIDVSRTTKNHDDKLNVVNAQNYEFFNAIDFYKTCLRRGYFNEDDILKIKQATGGGNSIDMSIDDIKKIMKWQIEHNLVNKNNNADGIFGEKSLNLYNKDKPENEMIVAKRQKLEYPDKKKVAKNNNVISLLTADDTNKFDISLDNSNNCIFYSDVNEFLTHYSTQQTIPFAFLQKLVMHQNFALITILISTANYGITDIPDDSALRNLDPLVKCGYYSEEDAFERFNIGKNAYAFPPVGSSEPINGGLGIAHFDASHYLEFYKVFGFPENCDINDLLYKTDNNGLVPLDEKDAIITINNASNNPLLVTNRTLKIINSNAVNPKTYDNSVSIGFIGVKNNRWWQAWAAKVVSSRIRQQYLFHYWKEHFWNKSIESYSNEKKQNPQNPHISLQNVIRSARAKNSGVAVDPSLSPEKLYHRYSSPHNKGRDERRVIQKMNIKRAIVLIEYILNNRNTDNFKQDDAD